MDITTAIGKNIRQYRQQKCLKLEILAKEICVSKATMSQIENGHTEITVRRIEKIARALDVEYNTLVTVNTNEPSALSFPLGNSIDMKILEKVLHFTEEVLRLKNRQFPSNTKQQVTPFSRNDLLLSLLNKISATNSLT